MFCPHFCCVTRCNFSWTFQILVWKKNYAFLLRLLLPQQLRTSPAVTNLPLQLQLWIKKVILSPFYRQRTEKLKLKAYVSSWCHVKDLWKLIFQVSWNTTNSKHKAHFSESHDYGSLGLSASRKLPRKLRLQLPTVKRWGFGWVFLLLSVHVHLVQTVAGSIQLYVIV